MSISKKTRAILEREDIRPSKARGQSFLVDRNMSAFIARAGMADGARFVLEIGAGTGTLTRELLPLAEHVLAVEKDARLASALERELGSSPRLTILRADFLTLNMDAYLSSHPGPWRVVANLPYALTSPILEKLLENRSHFDRFVLTVQKEVAQRLAASPGSKEYGALSVFIQMWCLPEILRTIPPDCFFPKPKVTSTLIQLKIRQSPAVQVQNEEFFEKMVRGLFQQRRKQLVNSLRSLLPDAKRQEILDLLTSIQINPRARVEELGLPQLARLSNTLLNSRHLQNP